MFNIMLLIIGLYIIVLSVITNYPKLIDKLLLQVPQLLSGLYLIFMFFKLQSYITI